MLSEAFIIVGERLIKKTERIKVRRYCQYTGEPIQEIVYKYSYFLESDHDVQIDPKGHKDFEIHGNDFCEPLYGIAVEICNEDFYEEVSFTITDKARKKYLETTGREAKLWYYVSNGL